MWQRAYIQNTSSHQKLHTAKRKGERKGARTAAEAEFIASTR